MVGTKALVVVVGLGARVVVVGPATGAVVVIWDCVLVGPGGWAVVVLGPGALVAGSRAGVVALTGACVVVGLGARLVVTVVVDLGGCAALGPVRRAVVVGGPPGGRGTWLDKSTFRYEGRGGPEPAGPTSA